MYKTMADFFSSIRY